MSAITGFGPFDTRASLPATPPADAAAVRPAAWFEGAQAGTSATLRAEVEPGASGLGVQQHAERVLAHLLAEPTALA
jgi:hypothetical protein